MTLQTLMSKIGTINFVANKEEEVHWHLVEFENSCYAEPSAYSSKHKKEVTADEIYEEFYA